MIDLNDVEHHTAATGCYKISTVQWLQNSQRCNTISQSHQSHISCTRFFFFEFLPHFFVDFIKFINTHSITVCTQSWEMSNSQGKDALQPKYPRKTRQLWKENKKPRVEAHLWALLPSPQCSHHHHHHLRLCLVLWSFPLLFISGHLAPVSCTFLVLTVIRKLRLISGTEFFPHPGSHSCRIWAQPVVATSILKLDT